MLFALCSLVILALASGCGSSGSSSATTTTTAASTTTTTTTTTTSTTNTTLPGVVFAVQGQATGSSVSSAGIRISAAVSGLANATVEVGYYDDDGDFALYATTTTDSDGKYALNVSLPTSESENVTVRVTGNGTTYRSTIPSVTTESTTTAPLCGPDSEIRSQIFYDMLTTQSVIKENINMLVIEQKTTSVDASASTADIQDLAAAFKNNIANEETLFNDLGVSDSNVSSIREKRTQLERSNFNALREAAYDAGTTISPLDVKTYGSSIESSLSDYADDTLGVDPTLYSSTYGSLDRRVAADVDSTNSMYTVVGVNAIIDRIGRGIQNKLVAGQTLATYLGTTIEPSPEADINTLLADLRANVTLPSTTAATGVGQATLTAFWNSTWYSRVNGSLNGGSPNYDCLAIQFCESVPGVTSNEAIMLNGSIAALWFGFNFNESDPTVWAQNISNMQTAALASIEATLGTVTTQNGITGDQAKKALGYVWGPSE